MATNVLGASSRRRTRANRKPTTAPRTSQTPRFKIVSPLSGAAERGPRVAVKIAIEATPDPIKAIRVQVNGRQVDEQTPDVGSGGFQPGERTLDVPLAAGRNEVRITLTNAIGEKAVTATLTHEGEGDLDKRGTLYILAIGVDKYPGLGKHCGSDGKASCDLTFSGADARAVVEAVEKRLGPAHTKVVKHVLVNGAADPRICQLRSIFSTPFGA